MPVFSSNMKAFHLYAESPRIIHTLYRHTYFVLSRTAVTLHKTDCVYFCPALCTFYQHYLLSLGSLMSQEGRKERSYKLCRTTGRLPQEGPLWHIDCFKYRLRERCSVWGHWDPPVHLTAGNTSSVWQAPSLYQEGETAYHQRWRIWSPECCIYFWDILLN